MLPIEPIEMFRVNSDFRRIRQNDKNEAQSSWIEKPIENP
jgi:hypothetical protein